MHMFTHTILFKNEWLYVTQLHSFTQTNMGEGQCWLAENLFLFKNLFFSPTALRCMCVYMCACMCVYVCVTFESLLSICVLLKIICKCLGPVQVRCSKYPLLLLSIWRRARLLHCWDQVSITLHPHLHIHPSNEPPTPTHWQNHPPTDPPTNWNHPYPLTEPPTNRPTHPHPPT